MAKIKPFKGIRPPKDLIKEVASRPYDVLNSEEAREEAKGNEKSLYHIIKPEIDFPVGTDEHDPVVSGERLVGSGSEGTILCICTDDERTYTVWSGCMCLCR